MFNQAVRLERSGQLPALGLRDFSLTISLTLLPGGDILTTPTWSIFQDIDHAEGHLNALLAPRCDFHTYETIEPDRRTIATLVRRKGSLFWYLGFNFDNEDHGTEYDLPASDYLTGAGVKCVLWPSALSPKEVRDVARRGL